MVDVEVEVELAAPPLVSVLVDVEVEVVVDVDVAAPVSVPGAAPVDVLVPPPVSDVPLQAANEATIAKLAAARAMVFMFNVIKLNRLLLAYSCP